MNKGHSKTKQKRRSYHFPAEIAAKRTKITYFEVGEDGRVGSPRSLPPHPDHCCTGRTVMELFCNSGVCWGLQFLREDSDVKPCSFLSISALSTVTATYPPPPSLWQHPQGKVSEKTWDLKFTPQADSQHKDSVQQSKQPKPTNNGNNKQKTLGKRQNVISRVNTLLNSNIQGLPKIHKAHIEMRKYGPLTGKTNKLFLKKTWWQVYYQDF